MPAVPDLPRHPPGVSSGYAPGPPLASAGTRKQLEVRTKRAYGPAGSRPPVASTVRGWRTGSQVWEHHSRGDHPRSFHGVGVHFTVDTFNDRISSTATDSSAPC